MILELPPGEEHGACNIAVCKGGVVGLSWLSHQPEKRYDTWFTASVDGAETFLSPVKVSQKSSRVLPFQERPNPGDDYLLMATKDPAAAAILTIMAAIVVGTLVAFGLIIVAGIVLIVGIGYGPRNAG